MKTFGVSAYRHKDTFYHENQSIPFEGDNTPGHRCVARVDMDKICDTTLEKVKAAISPNDLLKWRARWSALIVEIDIAKL